MRGNYKYLYFIVVSLVIVHFSEAKAELLFAPDSPTTTGLYAVDIQTGNLTLIESLPDGWNRGLAWGNAVTWVSRSDPLGFIPDGGLFSGWRPSWPSSWLGNRGLACQGGLLYSIGSPVVREIDPISGVHLRDVGTMAPWSGDGLASDGTLLYTIDLQRGIIWTINPATGSFAAGPSTGMLWPHLGLAHDGCRLLAVREGDPWLYTIDPATGLSSTLTYIGNTAGGGLAWRGPRSPCPACQLCGDCEASGDVNILDALRAAQMAAGIVTPQTVCCDVDSDTDVDVLDALKIAQSAAGLSVTMRCQ